MDSRTIRREHRAATGKRVEEQRFRQVKHAETGQLVTTSVAVRRTRPRPGTVSLKVWARDRGITKRDGRWGGAS